MNIEGEEEQGGLEGGMGTRQNISAPVPEKPKLSERVSTHRLHKRIRCLIALTFRNLTYKKMAISGKPGGVGWDGTHKADRSSHLRGGTLPSQVSYCQPTAAAQLPSLTPLGCAVGTASTLLP